MEVQPIAEEEVWSPHLTPEDAEKLDHVREALRRGDINTASRFGRVFHLTPVPKRHKRRFDERLTRRWETSDMIAWIEELHGEKDRAAAVLGVAALERTVQMLLKSFMVADDVTDKLLEPEQALGDFGAQIKIAYSLGLITGTQLKNLRLLAKIRNRFAHDLHGLSFATQSIQDLCRELILPRWDPRTDARDRFMATVQFTFVILQQLASRKAESEKRTVLQETNVPDDLESKAP